MSLPTAATVYYNGVYFPSNVEAIDASIRPTYDAAGRTVKFVTYDFTFRCILGEVNQEAGQTTDTTMEQLRVLLNAPGANFKYQNAGLGINLDINPAGGGGIRDVVWGPKPQLLRWKPYGNIAGELTWSIQFCIPECSNAQYMFAPMEYAFTLSYNIDPSGYTTRTYSGFVAIPQTRRTPESRTLTDQADRLRESIALPLVPGFRRLPGQFTLSEDKCKLNFQITDEEVGPNYLPPGVINASVSHDITTDKYLAGMYNATISADYELTRDQDRSNALAHFFVIAKDRLQRAIAGWQDFAGNKEKNSFPIPRQFRASHPDLYGRKAATFSITYLFLSNIKDLIRVSGLWAPVPNSNWQLWAQSLSNTAFHPRGNAKLAFKPSDDVIVDLCLPVSAAPVSAAPPDIPIRDRQPEFRGQIPPPDSSWIKFDSRGKIIPIDNVITLRTLPLSPIKLGSAEQDVTRPPGPLLHLPPADGADPARPSNQGNLLGRMGNLTVYPKEATGEDVAQVRAKPTVYVQLSGSAVRAGYEITPPAVVKYGGRDVVPVNHPGCGFETWQAASWFGVPIIAARWTLLYRVLGTPEGVAPIMSSPFAGY